MHGMNPTGKGSDRIIAMRHAQEHACNQTEFQSTTKFVPTAKYAVLNGTNYNGIYHYNGRADTYYMIGQAFGQAMITLLDTKQQETNTTQQETNNTIYYDNKKNATATSGLMPQWFIWSILKDSILHLFPILSQIYDSY